MENKNEQPLELKDLAQKWEDLKSKFELAEQHNEALIARIQNLLATVLKLNSSVMAWKCATGFLVIALVAVIIASLLIR